MKNVFLGAAVAASLGCSIAALWIASNPAKQAVLEAGSIVLSDSEGRHRVVIYAEGIGQEPSERDKAGLIIYGKEKTSGAVAWMEATTTHGGPSASAGVVVRPADQDAVVGLYAADKKASLKIGELGRVVKEFPEGRPQLPPGHP